MAQSKKTPRTKKYLLTALTIVAVIGVFHAWLHFTNPYAGGNIVQQPYITPVKNGEITVQKQFDLHVYSSPLADALG